jgi:hypothetical protein
MGGIVVIYDVGDAAIMDPALLGESVLFTRTSQTVSFPLTQSGKRMSATCCWQSESGGRGNFASIQSTVIP